MKEIRTSSEHWLRDLLHCYKTGERIFRLINDRNLPFHPDDFSSGYNLISAAYRANIPWSQIATALAGAGVGAVGIYLIHLAVQNGRVPTVAIILALAGGALTILGSLTTLYSFGVRYNVHLEGGPAKIIIQHV